jgi:hypothetical protein
LEFLAPLEQLVLSVLMVPLVLRALRVQQA